MTKRDPETGHFLPKHMTAEDLDRRKRGAAPPRKHLDLYLPADLLHRLKLVRALVGLPLSEWVTWQLMMAADLELARRPGTLWLRPGSRIYRMGWSEANEPVPMPIATSLGGERVWLIEVIPDLKLGELDDQLADGMTGAGLVVDVSAQEPGHLDLRRVVVAACDVLPREPMPWTTGFFTLRDARVREKARKRHDLAKLFRRDAATRDGGSSGPGGAGTPEAGGEMQRATP